MRTVTFQSVLWGVARQLGMDPTKDLGPARAAQLTEFINEKLKEAWEFEFWRELMAVEKRQYRGQYSNTGTYAATTEVFFLPTQLYYQNLQGGTGNDPATLSGTVYVENSAYWAECKRDYGAAAWLTNTAYAVGAQVYDPATDKSYQCITAHTSGGTIDYTKFAALTPFNAYIDYAQATQTPIGAVKRVTKRDPRVWPRNPWPVPFTVSANGIQVDYFAPTQVWVEFRTVPNVFSATLWSGGAFSVGDVVYYPTTGECYRNLVAGASGTPPPSNPGKWLKVDFPAVLASYVKRMGKVEGLREMKQTNRAMAEEELARNELSDAVDRDKTEQGQFESAGVMTYGTQQQGGSYHVRCTY